MSKRARSCAKDEDEAERAAGGKRTRLDGGPQAGWLSFMGEDGGCFQHFFTQMLDPLTQRTLCCVDQAHRSRLTPMLRPVLFPSRLDYRYRNTMKKAHLYARLLDAIEYDHAGVFADAWPYTDGYVKIRRLILEKMVATNAFQCALSLFVADPWPLACSEFDETFMYRLHHHVPPELIPAFNRYCLPYLDLKTVIQNATTDPLMPAIREFMQSLVTLGHTGVTDRVRLAIQSCLADKPPCESDEYELFQAVDEMESKVWSSSSSEDSSD